MVDLIAYPNADVCLVIFPKRRVIKAAPITFAEAFS
jgi:hypothetical protein